MSDRKTFDSSPGLTRTLLLMLAAIFLGIPMVAYLWETLHLILSLQIEGRRLLLSLPVLLLFAGLLRWIASSLRAGEGGDTN